MLKIKSAASFFGLSSASSFAFSLASSVAFSLVGLAACLPPSTVDVTPPRVVSLAPTTQIVPIDVSFDIQFSEELSGAEEFLNSSTAIIVASADADGLLSDLNSPPLSETNAAKTVPVELILADDGLRLILRPVAPLSPRTRYSLMLSEELIDLAGNPLADSNGLKSYFRYDFTTNDGPPAVLSHDVPNRSGEVVPTNRMRFTIWMDQPVRYADKKSISIKLQEGGGDVLLESIVLNAERTEITLILDETEECARLTASAEYEILFSSLIEDDEGENMIPFSIPFTTGALCESERNRVVGEVVSIAGENTASLAFATNHASTTMVWFGLSEGELDCAGTIPCPIVGAPAIVASEAGRFVHTVEILGLEVSNEYDFFVSAEDNYGTAAIGEGNFATAPLEKVAVNEILADPSVDEATAEFIELYNFGDEPIDLAGFVLRVDDTECSFAEDGSAPILAAGAFLVFAGENFDESHFLGLDNADVYRRSASTVCGSLVNSRSQSVVLFSTDGRAVSSFAGYESLSPKEGKSVERLSASEGDRVENFCYSRSTGPTPGRQNSVSVNGCE